MPVKVAVGLYRAWGMIFPPQEEPNSNTRASSTGTGSKP